ncbi:putative phage protein gp47/JayE [Volucribacter psittacicida]|uniref:Putative phage protein gp47/JayE n=1 Tax=Volucribacter psittacicida TaxID=203482 RepID=A0A4R1FUD4_9PAST|nr:baseplate J/gp47 family protein [Volucribacter psittacicida]TCJ96128.1 putative phage protein gp47/JayE [Volucribacter psittacicida]
MTTNVPSIQFTSTGVIIPTEQEILEGILSDFDRAFGGNLNRNLETPQGQLASSLAAIISDRNNQIAWLINNLDPNYSDGVMQDAIGKIYFVKRKGQVNSVVSCEFMGLPGTVIPKGFTVKDIQGNDWVLDEEISILAEGTVTGRLSGLGVYSAKANTVTELTRAIIGLDRVTNPQEAITGTEKESRLEFAKRYENSVAINSQGMPASIYSNVAKLDGVIDCYVIDNGKGTSVQIGATNKTLAPHSVYVAVVGGDNQEIAETIWRMSGNGCDYNGNTVIEVTDNRYDDPKPTYEIKFQRPAEVPIYFKVKVKSGIHVDAESSIKAAIKNYFNQNKGKIGGTIYAMGYIPSLITEIGKDYLLDVKVGKQKSSYSESINMGIDEFPVISDDNIVVEKV